MIRTLIFAGIAAMAGRQLYKSGALDRFGDDIKRRAEDMKARRDADRGAPEEMHQPHAL